MSRKESPTPVPVTSYDQTPPAFDDEVTVPTTTRVRTVIAAIAVNGGVATASSVNLEVEDAIGSGVFEIAARWRGATGTASITTEGTAMIPAGRKYRFVEDETGGNRSIIRYGFVDEK